MKEETHGHKFELKKRNEKTPMVNMAQNMPLHLYCKLLCTGCLCGKGFEQCVD